MKLTAVMRIDRIMCEILDNFQTIRKLVKTMKMGGKHPKIKTQIVKGLRKRNAKKKIVKRTNSSKNNQSQCNFVDNTVKTP